MALPSDVRKGSAFPKLSLVKAFARLRLALGVALEASGLLTERQSLSAHQTAKPQRHGSFQ